MDCNSTLSYMTDDYWRHVFGITMCIISVMGSVENSIVLLVLYRYKILRTSTNKILASLATADFLSSTIVAPLHAIQLLNHNLTNNCYLDSIRIYSAPILIGASAYIIGFISYDRCLHLRNLQAYEMSDRKLYLILSTCWAIAVVVPMVRLINTNEAKQVYSILVIMNAILVLAILIISYVSLLFMLKRHQVNTNGALSKQHMQNERRAVTTVVAIVTCYVIMLVPILIYHGLYSLKDINQQLLVKSYIIGIILAAGNSIVNPLVYCYRTPTLREYTRKLLGFDVNSPKKFVNRDSLMSQSTI